MSSLPGMLWSCEAGRGAPGLCPPAVGHLPRGVPGEGGVPESPHCPPAGLFGSLPDVLAHGIQGMRPELL